MIDKYILVNGVPTPEPDLLRWASWLQTSGESRLVDRTEEPDGTQISTVFLGLNHNFQPGERPLLYETMVFGGPLDGDMDRYPTAEEALEGHAQMVRRVRGMVEEQP